MAKLYTWAIAMLFCISMAMAQSHATARAHASATIVSPVGTVKNADLMLSGFTTTGPGEIVLSPNNDIITAGGVSLLPSAGSKAAGVLIYGSQYAFDITLPVECLMINQFSSEAEIRMCNFKIEEMESSHNTNIAIGATLQVQANQPPGVYEPAEPFEVVVSYN